MIFLMAILLNLESYASRPKPYDGILPTVNYEPSSFPTKHAQNHDLIQSSDGRIYIANNGGLVYLKGKELVQIYDPEERPIRSLGISPKGELYFGSDNSFGYLKVFPNGTGELVDLMTILGDDLERIGRIKDIIFFQDKAWFYSDHTLFVIDKEHTLIQEYDLKDILRIFPLEETLLVFEKYQLPKLIKDNGNLVPAPAYGVNTSELSTVKQVRKGEFLIRENTQMKFIYWDGRSLRVDEKNPQLDLPSIKINSVLPWNESFLLGTSQNGVLVLEKSGALWPLTNRRKGLQSNIIRNTMIDQQGNLWLAMDHGVSMVDLNSPIIHFGKQNGVNSAVNQIFIDEENMFLGTAEGLLTWNQEENLFVELENFAGECWSIEKVNGPLGRSSYLLAGTNAVWELDQKGSIRKVFDCAPYFIKQDPLNRSMVWVTTEHGFLVLKNKGNKWEEFATKSDYGMDFRKVVFSNNSSAWMAHEDLGVLQITLNPENGEDPFSVNMYDTTNGLPLGDFTPSIFEGWPMIGSSDGLYFYDHKLSSFFPGAAINPDDENINSFFISLESGEKEIWASTYYEKTNGFRVGYFDPDLNFHWKPFVGASDGVIFSIAQMDNTFWLGGDEGVFAIAHTDKEYLSYHAHTLIEEVSFGEDSILVGGLGLGMPNFTINSSRKPVQINFSSSSFKGTNPIQFKYRLKGFEKEWSSWTNKDQVVYTNLPGKKYSFEVMSRDQFGIETEISTMNFTVLPPWYQTWWAYTLYGFSFIAFVYGAVTISNRGLRMIIREKTKEITEQKDEIELANTELEAQNEEILAQRDQLEEQNKLIGNKNRQITDSIHYAQRIQLAILPPASKIKDLMPNSSIMYRPKDIVSGDFYWIERAERKGETCTLFAAVDCTGHGVPGAFVSIIGYNGLNRVVREMEKVDTGQILENLNEIVTKTLNPQGGEETEVKDGMDISLCSFNAKSKELQYSGAHNSLYLVRKGKGPLGVNGNQIEHVLDNESDIRLYEIKADKRPIGASEQEASFTTNKIKVLKDDLIFLFTDGFADQFGGPKGKKYMYKPFKRFLIQQFEEPIGQINSNLEKEYDEWRSDTEQIDDVCILAYRID